MKKFFGLLYVVTWMVYVGILVAVVAAAALAYGILVAVVVAAAYGIFFAVAAAVVADTDA